MTFTAENLVALFLGMLTMLATVLGVWWRRRESIEERLQRWQSETVQRATARGNELERRVIIAEAKVARVTHLELALRLAVDELAAKVPDSPVLLLLHDVLAVAYPVPLDTPEDVAAMLKKLERNA